MKTKSKTTTPIPLTILISDRQTFLEWIESEDTQLSYDDLMWLNTWNFWENTSGIEDETELGLIRYGHYLGWEANKV